tara:strand:+ start:407 stop:757 length:351 start_codon:yes stop_codon:yes gene_type:complete
MKKVLLTVNAEEYDHLCIAMDAHLDYLRGADSAKASGDLTQKIKCAENFYEKAKDLYWGRGKYQSMKKYNVSITQCHRIDGIEAESLEEAQRIASEDHDWDDHLQDVIIDSEEVEE